MDIKEEAALNIPAGMLPEMSFVPTINTKPSLKISVVYIY